MSAKFKLHISTISLRTSGWEELSKSFRSWPSQLPGGGLIKDFVKLWQCQTLSNICNLCLKFGFCTGIEWNLSWPLKCTILLPSHVTAPRGCKFLLVLCHWWSSPDSFHRWGLHSGESSSPVCVTWKIFRNISTELHKVKNLKRTKCLWKLLNKSRAEVSPLKAARVMKCVTFEGWRISRSASNCSNQFQNATHQDLITLGHRRDARSSPCWRRSFS